MDGRSSLRFSSVFVRNGQLPSFFGLRLASLTVILGTIHGSVRALPLAWAAQRMLHNGLASRIPHEFNRKAMPRSGAQDTTGRLVAMVDECSPQWHESHAPVKLCPVHPRTRTACSASTTRIGPSTPCQQCPSSEAVSLCNLGDIRGESPGQ